MDRTPLVKDAPWIGLCEDDYYERLVGNRGEYEEEYNPVDFDDDDNDRHIEE